MKKIILLFSLVATVAAKSYAAGTAEITLNKATPSATFDSIWVDYGVREADILGMKVHVAFSAIGMKNLDAYLAIYFKYNDDIAGFLKDKNKAFQSSEGDVAVYRSIKPAYDPAVYKDISIFIPYKELDLEPGIYDLTMDVKIIYQKGGLLQWLTYYDFEYTKPGSPADVESSKQADVTFDKLWIDYNVTENGKLGMRVHVKFTALNLKDEDCDVVLYFKKKSGEKIDGFNIDYKSKGGQLAVYKSLKPAFAEAVYNDLKIFMPYNEIKLGKGRFDLIMDANIILKNGDLVKHLEDHEFWIEQ